MLAILAVILAACDGGESTAAVKDCEYTARVLTEGARCVQKAVAATTQKAGGDDGCVHPAKEFREWGLGSYDADEVLRGGVDAYFRKYRNRAFCEELQVRQRFGYTAKR